MKFPFNMFDSNGSDWGTSLHPEKGCIFVSPSGTHAPYAGESFNLVAAVDWRVPIIFHVCDFYSCFVSYYNLKIPSYWCCALPMLSSPYFL